MSKWVNELAFFDPKENCNDRLLGYRIVSFANPYDDNGLCNDHLPTKYFHVNYLATYFVA